MPEPVPTASQAALEAARVYGVLPAEAKLPPEDEASLRAEVARYLTAAGGTARTLTIGVGPVPPATGAR